jgi:hypothetical protein
VNTFRKLGAGVEDTSALGNGFPDLVVHVANKTALVEVKADTKAKYTQKQLDFIKRWQGGLMVRVEDLDGAVRLVNFMRAA